MAIKKLSKEQRWLEEQKKILRNKVVIQKNDFIKGNTSIFSIEDLKIFKLIISKVKSQETLFDEFYEITTDEIKALNINETHLHKVTVNSLKKLANTYVRMEDKDGTPKEVGLIRNEFKFPKYSRKIIIQFNDDMREYLLAIKGNYTKYSLIDIVNFKLKHTLKLYEFLKSVDLNVMKVKVETLKKELDLTDKYPKFFEFKRRVLEPCIEEINEKTESLNVSYTLIKEGRDVTIIIFHIQRFDTKDILKSTKVIEHDYKHLIGLDCIYFDKYYTLEDLDLEKNVIFLREKGSDNYSNIMTSDKAQLENTLRSLYKEKFDDVVIDVPVVDEDENDELAQLDKIKDFKKFKEKTIEEYKNKELLNNAPNFLEDTIIVVNDLGLLVNSKTDKIITKEEAYEIWIYLFKNRDKIGVIEKVSPVKKFINEKIIVEKLVESRGVKDKFIYKIIDILQEKENQFRMVLEDIYDSKVEKAKTLLTYEQLESYINQNRYEEKKY